ncbi:sugar ABC transporter ATP-binding protein [Mesorhizobium sp. NPDC059025]|uniref:sugar ABC transporter ATP-binding protein n=1 Tax=unclassified Mesorhizobium TaxID=325217 RepID=UPI0036BC95A5
MNTSAQAGLAVEFDNVVKEFGAVRVLHGISFALEPGKVYGLLGENGAGKSTLMKILAGYQPQTSGEIRVNGKPVTFASSRKAEDEGIVMIHQEFNLADDLTISDNIFLGHEIRRGLLLDDKAMHAAAAGVLGQVGLTIDPATKVSRLIVAEKQLVEIAKALARNARLLIMDEPTATLTPSETGRLFKLIDQMRDNGVTIIYISHKLDEVERITDEVIVMRDGRFVGRSPTKDITRRHMANMMIGREVSDLYPPRAPVPAETAPMLRVRDFSVPGWASNINFEVRSGEILGFAGLVGAGRTELFEGILGLRKASGKVQLAGKDVIFRSPREAADHGLTYLSEDRKGKGLHVNFHLRENLTLMALERYANPLLKPASEDRALEVAVNEFGIRTGTLRNKASALSGGNQQKLALAKVLHPEPKVVVLDEPTRGVDIGAKRDIYHLINRLAEKGLAVVIISSELLELIGLAHRVVVMRAGHFSAEVHGDKLTEQELIAHATGTAHVDA